MFSFSNSVHAGPSGVESQLISVFLGDLFQEKTDYQSMLYKVQVHQGQYIGSISVQSSEIVSNSDFSAP